MIYVKKSNTILRVRKLTSFLSNYTTETNPRSASTASRRFLAGLHNEAQHSECTQDVAFNAHVSKNTIQWTLSNIDHLFDIVFLFIVITCSIRKFNETEPISSSTQMIECDLFRLCILAIACVCVFMSVTVCMCLVWCTCISVRDGSRRLRPLVQLYVCT